MLTETSVVEEVEDAIVLCAADDRSVVVVSVEYARAKNERRG